ncbi:MAG: universal stress protein [Pseudomonadota bacterium]
MFHKIMVPVDLDQPDIADRAIEAAKRIATLSPEAQIMIIAIATDPSSPDGAEEEQRLQAYIDAHRAETAMDGVLTLGGRVPSEIRYAAEEMGVDLIVMASHEPRLSDMMFGSRSASVALHTQCSVMVVR